MDFGLNLDPNQTNSFLQKMVGKLVDALLPVLKERLLGDELMTREQLAAWLQVSTDKADESFIFKPGFPFYMVGTKKRYWKRAVIKWIDENQCTK
ncbi:hypothetical protein [Lactiplantibacillus plantarum]|uniref:hypothetical protein n=1 Tax=Lactiplantibacillus plantarum TaxID=1590 RepID=UPI00223ED877|nr:hypothetical protein [Lactiplantibacillus plantarum]